MHSETHSEWHSHLASRLTPAPVTRLNGGVISPTFPADAIIVIP